MVHAKDKFNCSTLMQFPHNTIHYDTVLKITECFYHIILAFF